MISPQIRGIMAANRRRTVVPAAPAAPTLSATAGDTEVVLTWTQVVGVTGYKVYWDTDSGAPYANTQTVTVGSLADATAPTYTVTGLTNDTLYYFAVTAYIEY